MRRFARQYSSRAKDILKKSFERMEADKTYKKSAEDFAQLQAAARELGVPKQLIKQVYDGVQPGMHAKKAVSAAEKMLVDAADIAMFATPTGAEFNRPFEFDDLPSAGHLQLEEHRTYREFVRLAAYTLPQLSEFATEYRRPAKNENLKFKHYTFVGESHPAERKVVLTFSPDSTGLGEKQLHKLKLLAGPRYDPDRNEIKISSDRFPEQAQNKRYLGYVYSRLVQTAQDPSDTFEDVPLDPRAANERRARRRSLYPQHEFPAEWNRPDLAPRPKDDIVSVLSGQQ
ncbi:37S ribosomal protein S24, mitochondrial [Wickerhamiella sorbophila]|uniref:37S ribosomal protein S24, mitochondrial n=1 Tax=Wickerhamiella sorbophila TaxID=45607 RepID=A0A2T0FNH3_9ASCO|nr:37S ribosomal protein S24, mitochondrial [Wickerhamiella sorbophila]PRT56543.1 37S ribosomal protein S24, mitochondrial [Wickerhamiella sorbophila]